MLLFFACFCCCFYGVALGFVYRFKWFISKFPSLFTVMSAVSGKSRTHWHTLSENIIRFVFWSNTKSVNSFYGPAYGIFNVLKCEQMYLTNSLKANIGHICSVFIVCAVRNDMYEACCKLVNMSHRTWTSMTKQNMHHPVLILLLHSIINTKIC